MGVPDIFKSVVVNAPIDVHSVRPFSVLGQYFNHSGKLIAADFCTMTTASKNFFGYDIYLDKETREPRPYENSSLTFKPSDLVRLNASVILHSHTHHLDAKIIPDFIIRRSAAITHIQYAYDIHSSDITPGTQRIGFIFNSIRANDVPPGIFAPEIPDLNTDIDYEPYTTSLLDQDTVDGLASIGRNYDRYCMTHRYPVIWPVAGHYEDWSYEFLAFADDSYNPPKKDLYWLNGYQRPQQGFFPRKVAIRMAQEMQAHKLELVC